METADAACPPPQPESAPPRFTPEDVERHRRMASRARFLEQGIRNGTLYPVGGIIAEQHAADAEWHEGMAERLAAVLAAREPAS